MTPEAINADVVVRMEDYYANHLPVIPGAPEAVQRLASRWPLGLASSSNRPLIDRALEASGLASQFQATVSSEEVEHGKPHPAVFEAVASQIDVDPKACAAIEDSHTGVQSAHSAGMAVVLYPNASFPPGPEAEALAAVVIRDLELLTPELIDDLR